ncbi:hypothetical protein Aspvir_000753 [Aspergillus viridinutans]|uniref:Major facilitator superfamily (MFS) profile domain-containing protein n=1 Tax=Aspergillus viridinutans TaxID=75553 RepID=A0A9P3BRG1_ASPVI|nr:uncharacterized protein Aspvir_000753 [Aspergillus viridinutans]GIJ98635.1 hypothetical protein Aspvir_000753 [Aspergillus viridinutans]
MINKKGLYNWYVAMVAAGCMVLSGYDGSVFNSVQNSPHWMKYFDTPTGNLLGLINTTYTIGAIISGWFLGGPTADFLGRRWGMGLGCFITIIAAFIQTFAPEHKVGIFILGRVIIGIGQGMALTAGPIYIGEITPAHIRGKVMSFWQLFWSVGSFLAYWINYGTAKRSATLRNWDWKIVVLLQIIVPFLIICQLPFMPESPRWYIQKGNRIEDARRSLSRVRDNEEDIENELHSIRDAITFEKEAISVSYLALWKDKSIRKRLFLAFVVNIGQQLSGQGTLNTYSSTIYKKIWVNANTINLINALNSTCGILFTLNAVWTIDRFGRRFLFMVGAIGMATCMLLVATIGLTTPTLASGGKSEPVGVALVFLLFLFIFFYKPSWGATTWIWTSEIFSMNVRAQAMGMCSQMQNVANLVFQQFFPTFYKNCGLKSFFFFVACNVCLFIFVWFLIPETKQVTLEEMDVLFGGVNHVEIGEAMTKQETQHDEIVVHSKSTK